MNQYIFLLLCYFLSITTANAGGVCCDTGPGCKPPPCRSVITTPTGIAIDTDWKQQVYDYAVKNVVHPAWGLAHSERNYQVTKMLAAQEKITLDLDVLFAATFLHDLGGLAGFEIAGVDHAMRSVELAQPLLQQWGFPMGKWLKVKEMILGHTYYGTAPSSPDALAFRDADILDFLGVLGVARILAVTEETGFSDGTLKPSIDTLEDIAKNMANKCSLTTCKELAKPRQQELSNFLQALRQETFNGLAL